MKCEVKCKAREKVKCENGKCEMKSEVYTSGMLDKVREKCKNVKCEVKCIK